MAKVKMFFVMFVFAVLLLSSFAVAESHEGGTAETAPSTSVVSSSGITATFAMDTPPTFVDPGVTPDSFLHQVELVWESVAEPGREAEHADERMAELLQMVADGKIDAAKAAAEEAWTSLEEVAERTQKFSAEGKALGDIRVYERAALRHEDYAEYLKVYAQQKAAEGELPSEAVLELSLELMEESAVEAQLAVDEKKEEIIKAIAEEEGVTKLEAEIAIEEEDKNEGLHDLQKEEIVSEFPAASAELARLQQKLDKALAEGATVPNAVALQRMLAEARIKLQASEDAAGGEHYGEAFGQFTAAEHLLQNIDRVLTEVEQSPEEVAILEEELAQFEQQVKAEELKRQEEHKQFIDDYEKMREKLKELHPDLIGDFEKRYEQGQKALQLGEKLRDSYTQSYQELLTEGKSEAEATKILTSRFAEEYERVYGEPFIPPPMFSAPSTPRPDIQLPPLGEETLGMEGLEAGEFKTNGGFIKGYKYLDPATGYEYEFTNDGYIYTTPEGIEYEEKFPEGFTAPDGFTKGTEEQSYKIDTKEGTVEYKYYSTGYEVIKSDGTTEKFSYPEGDYKLPGGGSLEIDPTGFEVRTENQAVKYAYNPEFDTFVSPEGKSYTPPEGAYAHSEAVKYDAGRKKYEYKSEEKGSWTYDPASGAWQSSTGEKYTAPAKIEAPVGHEEKGSFTTESGESWSYNKETNEWQSSSGEKYPGGESSQGTVTYTPSSYDGSTGTTTTSSSSGMEGSAASGGFSTDSAVSTGSGGSGYSNNGGYYGGDGGAGSSGGSYGGDSSSSRGYGGDSGSSGGGDSGGSSSGGGDSGGSGGGGGGDGVSGVSSVGNSITGNIVSEPGTEEEPLLVKLFKKFLGMN